MGGRIAVEWVAGSTWNQWPDVHGMGGRMAVESADEPSFSHLTRLVFNFNGRDQGRLRELVDYINLPENWAQAQGKTQQRVTETA